MDEIVDPAALEAAFQEAMAPVDTSNNLIMTSINHETGEYSTDVFKVTDVATPTETKTVLVMEDILTHEEFKITVEELKNNG